MTLVEYEIAVEGKNCKFCGSELGAIESYDHEGGWEVEGYRAKQWLYKTCCGCGYQWSFSHLGYARC